MSTTISVDRCDSFLLSAEITLRQEEQKPGFSLQLLHITASETTPYNTRLASALCFKNFIKRNWTDEDGNYKLQEDEVTTLKRELISLMISVPSGIQSQLGEAVSVIADSDFWERWDTLVDVSCNSTKHCNAISDVLFSLGSRLEAVTGQPHRQHWCVASRALNFQEMETFVPVRCALHRDQPRSRQVRHSVPGPV